MVNTLFSCLAALHPVYSFAPRWRPPFVSALRPEDRCHLKRPGPCGRPTALRRPPWRRPILREGWRAVKATGGCLIEVPSGRIVVRGLALPHSPRVDGDQVFLLHSGTWCRLDLVDPSTGKVELRRRVAGRCARPCHPRPVRLRGPLESQAKSGGSAHRGPARPACNAAFG